MTPEEKAKAYDEAFERAKKLQENSNLKKWLLHIFPELKENEDERIRKLLISGMKNLTYTAKTFASIPIKDVIDWLEKQGNQREQLIDKACNILVDYIEEYLLCRMEIWNKGNKKQILKNILRKKLEE